MNQYIATYRGKTIIIEAKAQFAALNKAQELLDVEESMRWRIKVTLYDGEKETSLN